MQFIEYWINKKLQAYSNTIKTKGKGKNLSQLGVTISSTLTWKIGKRGKQLNIWSCFLRKNTSSFPVSSKKFSSKECQLIDAEGMIEFENHISTTSEVTDSYKAFQ